MKAQIKEYIQKLIDVDFDVLYPPRGFGDYSTNAAFLLAEKTRKKPHEEAEKLIEKLKKK